MTEIYSYSEAYSWDSCKRQWWYAYGLQLQPIEEAAAMNRGSKGHKLLQAFYEAMAVGYSKEKAQKVVSNKAKQIIDDVKASRGLLLNTNDLNILKAWTLVDNYIRDTEFTSEAVLVEKRFLIPAALLSNDPDLIDVQIGFTPDVVFGRPGGFYDVEDAKFVERAWSKSKLNRYTQNKMYQVFLRMMGYNVSRSTVRFFNVTTGKITHDDAELKQAEEKTLIKDFAACGKELANFKRQPIEIQSQARRTNNYTTCSFCPFEFPCTLEAEGKDATKTLETQYTKRNYNYGS